jgi:hypothetical protein
MAESQGNPPPNGGEGTDPPEGSEKQQPKFITAEELNRAITARFSDFEKRQKNSLTQILAEREKALAETLSERLGAALEERLAASKPKDEEQKPKGAEAPQPKLEDTPAYKALQKKLEGLEKTNLEEQNRRLAAEAKNRDTGLRSTLQSELEKHGITGERARLARGHLIDADKLVALRPDSDEIFFRSGDEEVPLADGLKSWIATDQAKIFLPPKGTNGSGDGPGGGSGGGGVNPNNPLAGLGRALVSHLRSGG